MTCYYYSPFTPWHGLRSLSSLCLSILNIATPLVTDLVFAIIGREVAKPRLACLVSRLLESWFYAATYLSSFWTITDKHIPQKTNNTSPHTHAQTHKHTHTHTQKTLFLELAFLLRLPGMCGGYSGLFSFLPSTNSDFVAYTFHRSHTVNNCCDTLGCDDRVPSKTCPGNFWAVDVNANTLNSFTFWEP